MNIFQQLFRMSEFCMAVRSTQLWSMAIFEHRHFTR